MKQFITQVFSAFSVNKTLMEDIAFSVSLYLWNSLIWKLNFLVFSQNYFDHALESKLSKESTKSFKNVHISQIVYSIHLPLSDLFSSLASLAAGEKNCSIKIIYISLFK